MRMKFWMRSFFIFPSLLCLSTLTGVARPQHWDLNNREKTLRFSLTLDQGNLSYAVACRTNGNETVVIENSPLGILRRDEAFTNNFEFVAAGKIRKFDESYQMLIGKQSHLRNRGVEQTFTFKNEHGAPLQLVVRAYADGVAFAYRFPEDSKKSIAIIGETTGFKLPAGRAWMLAYDPVTTWSPAYEGEWQNKIAVGTSAPANKRGWCFPALFNVRDHWVMLTEANMDGSCYGAHLDGNAEDGLYRVRLPEPEETFGVAPQEAVATLPWQSPWRVIIAGPSPGTIVESSLVYNLSAPSEIKDTSWIKPGRVSWSWWSDADSPRDYNKLVPFVDLAARFGWEYSLVDAGWPEMTNGNVWQLNDYAKSKGVKLILWYNSGGKHNHVHDIPRDIMSDPARREAEMAKLEKAGIKGIKVDFMQSDKQYLFVDFHGATVPRGWSRTFPNFLSMEGIAGAEQYGSTNFAAHVHTLNTIYTYTRNVVGPMDYTPVVFGNAPGKIPHQTTNPHELALSVAFESGLLHFADSVTNYLNTPDYVQDFLKIVPATWDETRYLGGIPGELTLLARRKGNDWYVAGLNGEENAKTVPVPLDFLRRGSYQASLMCDGQAPREFAHKTFSAKRGESLSVPMLGQGGFVLRLERK
jgi:alpha-glucosidase